jgi:metacaspase-1
VIGIDEYQDGVPQLRGCVRDSNNVVNYLRSLEVPQQNIRHLHKPDEVTREKVLNAFASLYGPDSNIERGGSVVVYFSGHGGRQKVEGLQIAEGHMVEVICPIDVYSARGIPDYTLASLLRRLQYERKVNIVSCMPSAEP